MLAVVIDTVAFLLLNKKMKVIWVQLSPTQIESAFQESMEFLTPEILVITKMQFWNIFAIAVLAIMVGVLIIHLIALAILSVLAVGILIMHVVSCIIQERRNLDDEETSSELRVEDIDV